MPSVQWPDCAGDTNIASIEILFFLPSAHIVGEMGCLKKSGVIDKTGDYNSMGGFFSPFQKKDFHKNNCW